MWLPCFLATPFLVEASHWPLLEWTWTWYNRLFWRSTTSQWGSSGKLPYIAGNFRWSQIAFYLEWKFFSHYSTCIEVVHGVINLLLTHDWEFEFLWLVQALKIYTVTVHDALSLPYRGATAVLWTIPSSHAWLLVWQQPHWPHWTMPYCLIMSHSLHKHASLSASNQILLNLD